MLPTIWETLYLLLAGSIVMIGAPVAQSGTRHLVMEIALAITPSGLAADDFQEFVGGDLPIIGRIVNGNETGALCF